MEQGADLMVFPGGAFEATKTQEERYTLQWRERYGFIRLAAQHGYPIIPMAIVGPEEFYDHAIEGRDLPDTALWRLLERLGLVGQNTRRDLLPPVPMGALGSLLPKPQRCYIQFGEPVRPRGRGKRAPGKPTLERYRGEVAAQIETMLENLLVLRDEDRNRQGWIRGLLTR
jgi:1-acyl-sn-glycerol-3-phosphate acyltransferase